MVKLWSPKNPVLYRLTIELWDQGKKQDEVESYFAMRKVHLGKDENGVTRLFLNNKPLFQVGPLDQGSRGGIRNWLLAANPQCWFFNEQRTINNEQ